MLEVVILDIDGTLVDSNDAHAHAWVERRAKLFHDKYLPKLQPFPEVRALMEKLVARGKRLVIATSAKKQEVDPLLKVANILDLIDKKTSSDDAERSKPDPDIVAAALARAKVAAANAIMIGDTPYDIEAANGAGVRCIAFRSGGWHDEGLKDAVAIYDGAADLLSSLDESPLAS